MASLVIQVVWAVMFAWWLWSVVEQVYVTMQVQVSRYMAGYPWNGQPDWDWMLFVNGAVNTAAWCLAVFGGVVLAYGLALRRRLSAGRRWIIDGMALAGVFFIVVIMSAWVLGFAGFMTPKDLTTRVYESMGMQWTLLLGHMAGWMLIVWGLVWLRGAMKPTRPRRRPIVMAGCLVLLAVLSGGYMFRGIVPSISVYVNNVSGMQTPMWSVIGPVVLSTRRPTDSPAYISDRVSDCRSLNSVNFKATGSCVISVGYWANLWTYWLIPMANPAKADWYYWMGESAQLLRHRGVPASGLVWTQALVVGHSGPLNVPAQPKGMIPITGLEPAPLPMSWLWPEMVWAGLGLTASVVLSAWVFVNGWRLRRGLARLATGRG